MAMWTEAVITGLAAGHILAPGIWPEALSDMATALIWRRQLLQYNYCICICSNKEAV